MNFIQFVDRLLIFLVRLFTWNFDIKLKKEWIYSTCCLLNLGIHLFSFFARSYLRTLCIQLIQLCTSLLVLFLSLNRTDKILTKINWSGNIEPTFVTVAIWVCFVFIDFSTNIWCLNVISDPKCVFGSVPLYASRAVDEPKSPVAFPIDFEYLRPISMPTSFLISEEINMKKI